MQRSNTFFKLCLLRTIDNMDFTDAENKHTDSISWPATRNKNNNLFCVKMGILTWYKHLAAPLSSDDGAVTPYKVTWMNASSGRSKTGTSNSSLRKDWKSTRINSERQIETYTSCDVDRLLKGWLRCNLSFPAAAGAVVGLQGQNVMVQGHTSGTKRPSRIYGELVSTRNDETFGQAICRKIFLLHADGLSTR